MYFYICLLVCMYVRMCLLSCQVFVSVCVSITCFYCYVCLYTWWNVCMITNTLFSIWNMIHIYWRKKNQNKKVQVWDLLDPRPLRNVISRIYHGFIDAIHNTLLTYFPNLFYFVRRAKPYLDFSLEWLRKKINGEFL